MTSATSTAAARAVRTLSQQEAQQVHCVVRFVFRRALQRRDVGEHLLAARERERQPERQMSGSEAAAGASVARRGKGGRVRRGRRPESRSGANVPYRCARVLLVFRVRAEPRVTSYERLCRSVAHVSAPRRATGRVVGDRQRAVRVEGAPELLAAGTRTSALTSCSALLCSALPCLVGRQLPTDAGACRRRCASCLTARGGRGRSSHCAPCSQRSASCTTCRSSAPTRTRCALLVSTPLLHTLLQTTIPV